MKKVSLRKRMCEPCGLAWQAWMDYRLPPRRGFTFGAGVAYDTSIAGIRDNRKARFEEWRDTVRHQTALVETLCHRNRHIYRRGPGGEPAAPALRYQSLPSLWAWGVR